MIEHVTFEDFCDRFRTFGRKDDFTYEAKRALFDYYEELEEDLAEQIELDVIGICYEWSEYASAEDALNDYGCANLDELAMERDIIELENGNILVSV